ncbi:ureidoglycolate hydrolase [Whalleya microplaca]|nr:ureidoglycolate hydrolase [Whalleya microplaca]
MLVHTIPLTQPHTLTAEPLTREAFAPFGDVLANPRPAFRPSNTPPSTIAAGVLPLGAVSANQGTAIQYRGLGSIHNLYAQAPGGGQAASPRVTMFVCEARQLTPVRGDGDGDEGFAVRVLERHPFTTQTFVPLTADQGKRYLVIVAPSLAPSAADADLPVPSSSASSSSSSPAPVPGGSSSSVPPRLPGRGLPDVSGLRAFIATGEQAVTYGAGTWHAPMVALGPADSTIDFIVFQFADDVPVEDCQEVAFAEENASARIMARVPRSLRRSKL